MIDLAQSDLPRHDRDAQSVGKVCFAVAPRKGCSAFHRAHVIDYRCCKAFPLHVPVPAAQSSCEEETTAPQKARYDIGLFCFRLPVRRVRVQPSHTRALRNRRSQGESSPQRSGRQLICTLRNTRSGCGISASTRPSAAWKPVRPAGEPLGLSG